ncbi:NAD dependent epimerase/dehydratase [Clonorchis sinensis]|uniref:NAD dependent epimerase/dehydratase n=1 Tax=Clonorchis sinensis TaxID=79923 RepID=G7YDV7_CLOSI|nr:NAD dependent epimerase/dehydratase [Clonorchis sinensis]
MKLGQKDSPSVRKPSIAVIGAGLGRTGTLSLKTALEHIFGEPCYHMHEILGRHREHVKKWLLVDELVSQSPDGHIDGDLFDEILQGYRCTVDHLGCTYYAQLMEHYPEAKIILTIRETTKWLDSVRHTFLKRRTFSWMNWLVAFLQFGASTARMFDCMTKRSLGYTVDVNNDKECAAAFERWNQRVQRYVPAERILVFRVTDGWEPLCHFLQVPVPTIPFPHRNTREEFHSSVKSYVGQCRIQLIVLLAVGLVSYVLLKAIQVLSVWCMEQQICMRYTHNAYPIINTFLRVRPLIQLLE